MENSWPGHTDRSSVAADADSRSNDGMEYEAFISYSHTEHDSRVAREIQRFLEGFSIPKPLRERAGRSKLGKVFRDEDELAAGPSLAEGLEEALRKSRWLIVVCSPVAAASPWIAREIETFITHHGHDRVLAVLATGEPCDAFPEPLRQLVPHAAQGLASVTEPGLGETRPQEPIAADLRDTVARQRRRQELWRILAPVIGCSFDELAQRQRVRRIRRIAIAGAAALCIAVALGAVLAQMQRQTALAEYEAQARQHLELAQDALADGDRMGAIEHVLNALPQTDDPKRVAEAQVALSQALGIYRPFLDTGPLYSLTGVSDASSLVVSEEGGWFAVLESSDRAVVYEIETGAVLSEPTADSLLRKSSDNSFAYLGVCGEILLTIFDDGGLAAYDMQKDSFVWERHQMGGIPWLEMLDDGRIACLEYGDDGLYLTLLDGMTGELFDSIGIDGIDADAENLAMAVHGDSIAVTAADAIAIVNVGTGDIQYGKLAVPEVTGLLLDDERIYAVSSVLHSDLGIDDTWNGSATVCAYNRDDLALQWSFERSWTPYHLEFSDLPFGTDALLRGFADSEALGCRSLLVSVGTHALMVDASTGEILVDAVTEAPVVYLGYVSDGDVLRAADITGARYVARVDPGGTQLASLGSFRFFQYTWDVVEAVVGGSRYAIGCSAEETSTLLVCRDGIGIPEEPGVEQIDTTGEPFGMFSSEDGSRAAVFDGVGTVDLLDGETFQRDATIDLEASGVVLTDSAEAFMFFTDSDASRFIIGDEGAGEQPPRMWSFNAETGELLATWELPLDVEGLTFDTCMFSSERGGCVTVYYPEIGYLSLVDVESLETVQEFDLRGQDVADIMHVRDDRYLVVYESGIASLYDCESLDKVGEALEGADLETDFDCAQIAVSPDKKRLVAISIDGQAMLVDVDIGDQVWSIELEASGNEYAKFSLDGTEIYLQDENRRLLRLDAETGEEVASSDDANGFLVWCRFSSDGDRLLAMTTDGTVRSVQAFDVRDGGLRLTATIPCGMFASEEGDAVFVQGTDNAYRQPIYSLEELSEIAERTLREHEGNA